jgi:hypothetical protein
MLLELEEQLRQYCAREALDLHERLGRVKETAKRIWNEPRLDWFTDHGFDHSQRIVNLLGQIVEHLQKTEMRLSSYELYILLAACYLHDIGMQALSIDGRIRETFRYDDYEFIRRRHPRRAYELIIERSTRWERGQFQIYLDDQPAYNVPIALVSQGHGSDFFKETLNEFAQKPYSPGGRRIRGDLLTALLLMADELDLQEERARFPAEMDSSPISSLHNHIHHYVINVEVTRGEHSKQRRIRLDFEFPKDSAPYKKMIRRWVVGKLQRQCRLTAPIIRQTTDGELDWCEQITICETFDRTGVVRRSLPSQALAYLEGQTKKRDTINYDEAINILRQRVFESREHYVLCLVIHDEGAAAMIIGWLKAQCAYEGVLLLSVGLQNASGEPGDIPILVHRQLVASTQSRSISKSQQERDARFNLSTPLANLHAMIGKDLRQIASRRRVVLVFQYVDLAGQTTADWLENNFLQDLGELCPPIPVILIRSTPPGSMKEATDNYQLLQLGDFSEEDIATHCQRAFGFCEQEVQRHAQGAYTATNGKPANVVSWFEWLRGQECELI